MTAEIPALVLAGDRRGEADPVAVRTGVAHKCLAPVAGTPMLCRVVETLVAVAAVGRIHVAFPDPHLLARVPGLAPLLDSGRLRAVPVAASVSQSVAGLFAETGPPLLVTTADHPLLTVAMVERFLDLATREPADLVAGLVAEETIRRRLPDTRRTFLRFRDRAFSGANLFLLAGPGAAAILAFWQRVERERKRPWRIARALGPGLLLAYLLRRLTLDAALERASRRIGGRVRAVVLPFAEAAVDVDKPADLELVERLLAGREAA